MAIAVDVLDEILEDAWRAICHTYDVTADLPEISALFHNADLTDPVGAAERVLLNMLVEATECVGRFSPWYTLPARAFGIIRVRESATSRMVWMLAPEAAQRWEALLAPLAEAVRSNTAMLEADRIIDSLIREQPAENCCVMARCACQPEGRILVSRAILDQADIVCKTCRQPYRLL
jgi:hypothetical protein